MAVQERDVPTRRHFSFQVGAQMVLKITAGIDIRVIVVRAVPLGLVVLSILGDRCVRQQDAIGDAWAG